ncbi:RNA recognition domain-containing protein [Drepanopeziza brunnea f. sp. 'multigermtubi' MB_m1]|uniref:RNA recognition domain-containing protein n=1 Tax=Marssonina brunnea f. sp. multigermtubi (strain MB_m1) TaxID=1072389 RepID=K1X5W3_MARBU|nr:RNA recognition domain-containing protein [Drepanopeziza brunnea f. sp. 'multigermtubi' MB_m1]EKD16043.1 RNA recognition domain-containing protein [Drepanopeziza brunnea f. sp. 'multigermtubi' MB_m1]
MSANTVHVKNISSATSKKEISSLELTPADKTQNATVTFEKETAAKTALLLDNTQLGASSVQVTSATGSNDDDGSHFSEHAERDSDEITQEEKPRSRIAAEYIAHGYVLGDQAIQKAIDLDNKHGVSNRFLSTLTNLDAKYHATDKAKSVDQSYGVSQKAGSLLSGLSSYFEKAVGTPTGQKLVNFYSQSSKQVQDIHAEARRLADLKKTEAGVSKVPGTEKTTYVKKVPGTEKTTCNCGGDTANCPCAPGACACSGCPKASTEKVPGTDKTTCKCGGDIKNCPCAPGACACDSCPKVETKKVAGTDKTTCNCGGDDKNCPCEPGKCASTPAAASATTPSATAAATEAADVLESAKVAPLEPEKGTYV